MRGFNPNQKSVIELSTVIQKIRKVELILSLRLIDLQRTLELEYWESEDLKEVSQALTDLGFIFIDPESKEAAESLKKKVTGS